MHFSGSGLSLWKEQAHPGKSDQVISHLHDSFEETRVVVGSQMKLINLSGAKYLILCLDTDLPYYGLLYHTLGPIVFSCALCYCTAELLS